MRITRKSKIILFSSIMVLAYSGAIFGVYSIIINNQRSSPIVVRQRTTSNKIRIDGLNLISQEQGKIKSQIRAKEFRIGPKELFLNIKLRPFTEVSFKNLNWKIYLDETQTADLFSFSSQHLKQQYELNNIKGVLPRGIIKRLTMEIYKQERLSMLINARKVSFNLTKKSAKLTNFSLVSVKPWKMIKSKTVFWDNELRLFKIPGDYIYRTAEGVTKGNSIAVDLDFTLTKM